MKRKMIIFSLGISILLGGCSNTYDAAIDKVLSLETANIKDAKRDIDKVERDKTCTKVYQDGKIIEIAYKIRKDHTAEWYYTKSGDSYKRALDSEVKKKLTPYEKPVYEENCE
ncbi:MULTISPECIES: cystatin-like fold lipoprotein [Bacillus cereus group]|uniref:cystatin-like fold lipoprotein n=1 Tax=Bacillus cereus group TaxID=86661 RepID=UPI000279F716|nr:MULTISPECIES: cystatin-like fold lipoprotein [Bacillus cereus group]EJR25245.1 hypothetical protein IIE_06282 [Bacillus cereus VD045]